MNYSETLAYLFDQLPMYQRIGQAAYKTDLGNTIALCSALGNPQNEFKSIHIAGTNGKGSVSHFLASILQSAGYKTGLYTSPHLKDFRERIRINGAPISEAEVVDFVAQHTKDFSEIDASFFEYTVGMAFEHFSRNKVDIAVIETGLGGRLDSTNIISPHLSVITNIGLDHTQFLGNTLESIAVEKAGIIKINRPVVIGQTQTETTEVFLNTAKICSAPIVFADQLYHSKQENGKITLKDKQSGQEYILRTALHGSYQTKNLVTVVATIIQLRKQGFEISDLAIQQGVQKVKEQTGIRGRWEVLNNSPMVIADIAHNAEGIRIVVEQLLKMKNDSLHFVIGLVEDKNIDTILELFPKDAQYYFCKANIPRGLNALKLRSTAFKHNLKGNVFDSVQEAYDAAREAAKNCDLVFIGGSTFIVAEIL